MPRTTVDIAAMRDLMIRIHGLARADRPYTLYYDETNNIRRLLLTPDGMNNPNPKCFALGGIAHCHEVYDFQYEELRKVLRLQPSTKEIKLAHLGKGDFLAIMASQKVETFLDWLIAERLYIHCAVLDPLYWSTVNIIDSVLAVESNAYLLTVGHNLKSDLYTLLALDRDHLVDFLYRYTYPNVGKEQRGAFISELLEIVEDREDAIPHFNYQMLKGALQIAARQSSLPYLEDETANILIDELSGFFINRICILKNSRHIFDQEPWIEDLLDRLCFQDQGRELKNFEFTNSKADPGIQISDVLIGLLGKYYSYLNQTDWSTLQRARASLDERQKRNVKRLKALIDGSVAENIIFLHSVVCIDDHRKSQFFLES